MDFYNLQKPVCSWEVFFPTTCFVKGWMREAGARPLALLQLCWVLSKPRSPREHTGPRPAFPMALLHSPVFVLPVWVADTESWQLHCLEGKKALIPQWNAAAVLAALGTVTVGERCPHPLCQLRAPEIFPLADCGNASKLSSAWIISEMLGTFRMPALVLVIAMLSLALETNIIVGCLFVFIRKAPGYVSSAKA